MDRTGVQMPRLLTKWELCDYLGVSRHWVQRAMNERRLPGVIRLGPNTVRFDAERIASWLRELELPVVEGGE